MIDFSDFHTNDTLKDTAVGISIQEFIKGSEQGAYASVIEAGKPVRYDFPLSPQEKARWRCKY